MYKHLKHWKRIRRSHLKLGLLLFTSLHLNDKSVLPTSLPARPDLRSPPKSRCILRIFSKQYILVVPLIYFPRGKETILWHSTEQHFSGYGGIELPVFRCSRQVDPAFLQDISLLHFALHNFLSSPNNFAEFFSVIFYSSRSVFIRFAFSKRDRFNGPRIENVKKTFHFQYTFWSFVIFRDPRLHLQKFYFQKLSVLANDSVLETVFKSFRLRRFFCVDQTFNYMRVDVWIIIFGKFASSQWNNTCFALFCLFLIELPINKPVTRNVEKTTMNHSEFEEN